MNKENLLLWLHEQKSMVEDKLHELNRENKEEDNYKHALYAKQSTFDEVIKYVEKNI